MIPANEIFLPNSNGLGKPQTLEASSFTYSDTAVQDDTMGPRTKAEQDEKLAEAVEQLSILMLRMDSRLVAGENKKTGLTPIVGIIISAIALLVGIIGGLVGSVAVNAQWKGDIEARIKIVESQRTEDKRDFIDQVKYVQTQNEVNGKTMARIEARLDSEDRRKGR